MEIEMVSYEVTLEVVAALAPSVEQFMTQSHIPDIYSTGCFRRISFSRASPTRFRTAFQADTQGDLDRYLRDHAPRLRAEFQGKFGSGVTLTRETWVQREVWP